jgi:hypothetical protein
MSCGLNTQHQFMYPAVKGLGSSAPTSPIYPFSINFAPRSIPPTIMQGFMIEDAENNTILYKGTNYQLVTIQICNATHKNLAAAINSYDLVLSFINWSQSVKVVLVIIPIFEDSIASPNAAYFKQIKDDTVTPVSLGTLFTTSPDTSCYGYSLCLNLYNSYGKGETKAYNTDVYYFKTGVTLAQGSAQGSFQSFFGDSNNLPHDFRFLPGWMGDWQTTKYDDNGNEIHDPEGGLSYKLLQSSSDVQTWLTYYMQGPPASNASTCPYIPVNQYKCYPFDQLKNVDSSGLVHPGIDLTTGIKQSSPLTDTPALDLSWESIQTFILPLIGFIVLIILLALLLWALSWLTKPPPLSNAAEVAAAGPPPV